jgi:hypothetical protein
MRASVWSMSVRICLLVYVHTHVSQVMSRGLSREQLLTRPMVQNTIFNDFLAAVQQDVYGLQLCMELLELQGQDSFSSVDRLIYEVYMTYQNRLSFMHTDTWMTQLWVAYGVLIPRALSDTTATLHAAAHSTQSIFHCELELANVAQSQDPPVRCVRE